MLLEINSSWNWNSLDSPSVPENWTRLNFPEPSIGVVTVNSSDRSGTEGLRIDERRNRRGGTSTRSATAEFRRPWQAEGRTIPKITCLRSSRLVSRLKATVLGVASLFVGSLKL